MFGMLKNLTKAAVAVAITPVTLAADVVMAIPDASDVDPNKPVFGRTTKMLKAAGMALDEAVKPERD
jgi:hypothetical protein